MSDCVGYILAKFNAYFPVLTVLLYVNVRLSIQVERAHKLSGSGVTGVASAKTRSSVEASHAHELLMMAQMAAEEANE